MKCCISLLLLLSLYLPCTGQAFKNLDFKQACDTSRTGLCYWDRSWGGKGALKPERVNGKPSLLITGNTDNSVGFAEQSVSVDPLKVLAILTVSADIKSDSVTGKGAGLNIGLYDQAGLLIANKDMGGFYSIDWIRGNSAWRRFSISIVCPLATSKIKIGAILYGGGKAWYKDYKVTIASIENRKPNKLAVSYITAVCDSIKKHSLVRDSLDVIFLKATALKIAGNAKKYSDCYLAVNYLLESLRPFGDEHSFFMKADEVRNWKEEGSQVSKIQFPSFRIIDSCGYIAVPAFHGGNQSQILAYADSLQSAIKQLYESGIRGWLIDLRQNTGGNMAPMIAGLGPLFSTEKLGALVNVEGKHNAWYYKNGRYSWDDDAGWAVPDPAILSTRLPVAVLTSSQTGSSGEAVVLSFKANERTKSFGQPTWGLTTGNGSFELKDGSQIFLASTIMADRNGKLYHGSIQPDVVVEEDKTAKEDLVMRKAVEWIRTNLIMR
jgi:carboxyl-terminal processing protease